MLTNEQVMVAVYAYKLGFSDAMKTVQANSVDSVMNLNMESVAKFFSGVALSLPTPEVEVKDGNDGE